jgi:sec-independent protein translocase protein TatB
MQIFNIGPVELILILLIMFILLGPEGMIKTARQIGKWVRELVRSPIWKDIMGYSREIRELPTKIVRETGLDEDLEEIRRTTQDVNKELQQTVSEANREVQQTLKEAGSVDVRLDTNPPSGTQSIAPPTASTPAGYTPPITAPASAQPDNTVVAAVPVVSSPLPPAQTFDKYGASSDEDEEE